ncbi:fungal-specific transcription factor domain-containing protein [Lipomyces kononenkoae]|uniref:Fungal-specific transcription factor domain-containing protein n=1 Tax=Lipomyces kononenkoae TaxID=34357 RepID=A0ACC3SQZ8_LIPKO
MADSDSDCELSADASINYPWLLRTHDQESRPQLPTGVSSTPSLSIDSAPLSPTSSISSAPSRPPHPHVLEHYYSAASGPSSLTAIPRSVPAPACPASYLLSLPSPPFSEFSAVTSSLDVPFVEPDVAKTRVPGTRRKSCPASSSTTAGRNIRRRITRACDQCNQLRTKCDGKQPCLHCFEFSLQCEYIRERKKRGKASKRELAENLLTEITTAAPTEKEIVYTKHVDDNIDHSLTGEPPTFDWTSTSNGLSSLLAVTDPSSSRPALSGFSFAEPMVMLQPTPPSGTPYPVLNQILPQLLTFMPPELPQDLLETYFGRNIYRLAPLLRKSSILSSVRPRCCSPSLVYSLLLSAAYTSENPHMTSSASARLDTIHRLFDLCMSSLNPVLHSTSHGTVDDVMTYIHLGTLSSASENNDVSLRWWNAAWTLARELKLNKEHPDLGDEVREEMRRTWWLLYMVDRHLGLCYNRPLAILDAQCMGLHRPLATEEEWDSDTVLVPAELILDASTKMGVNYSATGKDIFGFFLALMAILGGIVELHHLNQHPTISLGAAYGELAGRLSMRLDVYERSLQAYDDQGVWHLYATHFAYVLRILLAGYYDPLDLLLASDSKRLTTNEFMTCTAHGLRAADLLKSILKLDPELVFMPFFFGVHLLHNGFVWLALVDMLESDVTEQVRDACETVVRAHEVCIVTLNTGYHRNFLRVMRGALLGLRKGIEAAKSDEGRRRRREIAALYRWCAGGNGLAG